jgi:hypothetical protein
MQDVLPAGNGIALAALLVGDFGVVDDQSDASA